jgi:hypothetical protein
MWNSNKRKGTKLTKHKNSIPFRVPQSSTVLSKKRAQAAVLRRRPTQDKKLGDEAQIEPDNRLDYEALLLSKAAGISLMSWPCGELAQLSCRTGVRYQQEGQAVHCAGSNSSARLAVGGLPGCLASCNMLALPQQVTGLR